MGRKQNIIINMKLNALIATTHIQTLFVRTAAHSFNSEFCTQVERHLFVHSKTYLRAVSQKQNLEIQNKR